MRFISAIFALVVLTVSSIRSNFRKKRYFDPSKHNKRCLSSLFFHTQAPTTKGSPVDVSTLVPLDSLDEYSLLDIFDWLPFNDLVNMAEMSPRIHEIIEAYYMIHKYHLDERSIIIDASDHSYSIIDSDTNDVLIHSYSGVLYFLRHFGSVLKHLEISRYFCDDMKFAQIIHFVQMYCKDTLEMIDLRNEADISIDLWDASFPRVRNVSISNFSRPKNLPHIFPNIQNLSVTLYQKIDFDHLYLPELKHFSFRQIDINCDINFLKNTIRLNQQLQSIHIDRMLDTDFMQFLTENLRNLTNLSVKDYPFDYSANKNLANISFPNVKKLSVGYCSDSDTSNPFPLTFDQLEILKLRTPYLTPKLNNFIKQNKQLKSIVLQWVRLQVDDLNFLITELPELFEIKMKWTDDITPAQLIEILNRSHTLRFLSIFTDNDVGPLLRIIEADSGWNLVEDNSTEWEKRISFRRNEL